MEKKTYIFFFFSLFQITLHLQNRTCFIINLSSLLWFSYLCMCFDISWYYYLILGGIIPFLGNEFHFHFIFGKPFVCGLVQAFLSIIFIFFFLVRFILLRVLTLVRWQMPSTKSDKLQVGVWELASPTKIRGQIGYQSPFLDSTKVGALCIGYDLLSLYY